MSRCFRASVDAVRQALGYVEGRAYPALLYCDKSRTFPSEPLNHAKKPIEPFSPGGVLSRTNAPQKCSRRRWGRGVAGVETEGIHPHLAHTVHLLARLRRAKINHFFAGRR